MHALAAYQYQTLHVNVVQNIVTVTLNRPQKKNAMNFKISHTESGRFKCSVNSYCIDC